MDDHADLREMYSLCVGFHGLRCLVAGDDITAIRVARAMPPDVIVIDLSRPWLDGWEAARRLKEDIRTAHIAIVACNGHADDGAAEEALRGLLARPTGPRKISTSDAPTLGSI